MLTRNARNYFFTEQYSIQQGRTFKHFKPQTSILPYLPARLTPTHEFSTPKNQKRPTLLHPPTIFQIPYQSQQSHPTPSYSFHARTTLRILSSRHERAVISVGLCRRRRRGTKPSASAAATGHTCSIIATMSEARARARHG